MYVSRTVLVVLLGVFMLPPLLAQWVMHLSYGWLMPAGLWALIILCSVWLLGSEHRHG